jgi:SPFH domain / Band 7 family
MLTGETNEAAHSSDEIEISVPAIILGLITVLIVCVTVPLSYHYIRFDQYALLQNVYGTVRLSKVYGQGTYFYPLNFGMVTFPSTYQFVEINAAVFTNDGVQVVLDIVFYFRLPKERVGDIYNQFSTNYNTLVYSNAKTVIKNTAAPLTIDMYIKNISYVEMLFANSVMKVCTESLFVDVPLDLFRLQYITIPDSILQLSLHSAFASQNNELLTLLQQVSVLQAETRRLVAVIEAQTNQTINFAANTASQIVAYSQSFAEQVQIKARGDGIYIMLNALGLQCNTTQKLEIINALALIDNSGNTSLISPQNSVLYHVA